MWTEVFSTCVQRTTVFFVTLSQHTRVASVAILKNELRASQVRIGAEPGASLFMRNSNSTTLTETDTQTRSRTNRQSTQIDAR